MKNEVRNIKDKWKTKRNIKCKFKWTQKMKNKVRNNKNRKIEPHSKVNCKMKMTANNKKVKRQPLSSPTWIWGSGYCTNVAHRFPYDRGKDALC